MKIGGLQKFSLLDYPENISAIVFTQGCNFRCSFCYNPMLVLPKRRKLKDHPYLSEGDLFEFLNERKGKLGGIVITGGEPTIHKDLPELIKKIKDLGFKIKLDTNGTNPEMLKKLINKKLINYIAMDIKCTLDKYKKATKFKGDFANIKKSVKMIMNSKLPYEFRTTVVPSLVEKEDIKKMGETIKGASVWYLQQFKPDTDLINKDFQKIKPYEEEELVEMAKIARKYVKKCEIR